MQRSRKWVIINKLMSVRKQRSDTVQVTQFRYEVHASNFSDLHLVINRTRIPSQVPPELPRDQSNPYIFKPKSYSSRRAILPTSLENQQQLRSNPSKKIKRETCKHPQQAPHFSFDPNVVTSQLTKNANFYFSPSFLSRSNSDSEKASVMVEETTGSKQPNPNLKCQITIVSNSNQKIQVVIHEGLLLANMSHPKICQGEHFLKDVRNPFDYKNRNLYLKKIKFQKQYKSGYAPIQMQKKNAEEPEENNAESKTHFIRKKQSTLSLPRSCGVSYIKPTQSAQTHPFDPLPPLIFQCSSRCQSSKKYDELSESFNAYSQSSWLPYIATTEDDMRDLLLGKKIGQAGWVKGIQSLWPLFGESTFFLLLFPERPCFTEGDIWRAFGECSFKIGVLAKKSTSGKKAFLKSLNIKESSTEEEAKDEKEEMTEKASHTENDLLSRLPKDTLDEQKDCSLEETLANQLKDCRTVVTLSLRLEMYVEESQWKNCDKEAKDMLNYLITNLKDNLEKGLLNIIKKRFTLAKQFQNSAHIEEIISNLRVPSSPCNSQGDKLQFSKISVDESSLKSIFSISALEKAAIESSLFSKTSKMNLEQIHRINKSELSWERNLKMPLYYISTRDSFAFDLVEKVTYLTRNGRTYKKINYYFEPDNLPTNYGKEYKERFPNLDVGVTCYHNFFTPRELEYFERNTFETEKNAFKNKFLQMTVQPSIVGSKIKRTKFFFGYRYMWTRCQLAEPGSYVGAGVRRDVTEAPKWTQSIVNELVKSNIAEDNFINSIAINVYHDGKEGLAQHFDDAVRFKQPIYTLRLFSDARLSFGSQLYGFCNGAFIVPLPRGCVCVMEENSYAANGVKHCVRPCDMTGKSSAVILRQMHHKVVSEVKKYDELIDFPAWVSCLSSDPEAVSFAEQKRREAQFLANTSQREEAEK